MDAKTILSIAVTLISTAVTVIKLVADSKK